MVKKTTLAIVSAGDNNFTLPLAVMLHSALTNSSPAADFTIYLISDGITPANKRKIEHVVDKTERDATLIWKEADAYLDRTKNFVVGRHYSRTTYLRLFIPEIIDPQWARIIYLDGDMVVEHDLVELWQTDMSNNILLAVQDFLWTTVSSQGALPKTYQRLGLDPDTPLFNGGMFLMNVGLYIENRVAEKAIDYLERYPETINFVDQDALNAAVLGRWGLLDSKWNVQAIAINEFGKQSGMSEKQLQERREELIERPYILHYNGHHKPWHLRGDKTLIKRFLRYLKSSGWFTQSEFNYWYYKMLLKYTKEEVHRELRKYKYQLVKKLT